MAMTNTTPAGCRLLVPPMTPFTESLDIDVPALGRVVDHAVATCGDVAMLVAGGVEAQEYQYLDLGVRRDLISATVDAADGRASVSVGISHPSFRQAIELAQHAEKIGAQALLLLAPLRPFGGTPTTGELVAYFEAVGRETSLPIGLYLNAGPGADLSVPATVELAGLDCVHYVKESSRDLARVSRLIAEVHHTGLARYFTTMQMLLPTLQMGGAGAAVPTPAATLSAAVVRAFEAGDVDEAVRLQSQFSLFPARWMHHGLMPTMKATLNLMGLAVGDPYPPFPPITGHDLEQLRELLETGDLLSPKGP
jgi:4-hydroxy-tetrahydrodipicolinate synthase